MAAHESSAAEVPHDHSIGGRYTITAELGRGGMACVYHAVDSVSGRALALKQLLPQTDARRARESALLFEREFHTLTQLAHPRVIQVYDYGVDCGRPYYTMELLDGGDLRERSPMPWRQACELIYDVCSSLALLHSRRLVHRDVSPRNVRCTHSGRAKLIDFGAMVPMGAHAQPVGTPPFVAPEVVNSASLDARTDLFSLGATLYFALTGRLAYPARDFSQLIESWSNKPPRPSSIVADVPAPLDQLVSSLISLEPALRPRSAFEVMQRLQTLADIQREEPLSVSQAYLVTPSLVGREQTLAAFQEYAQRAQHGRGRGLVVAGAPGLGRTRVLDACVLDAKMRGACVLRVTAADSCSDFGVAQSLAARFIEQAPEAALAAARSAEVFEQLFAEDATLKAFASMGAERATLQRALSKWFIESSKVQALTIALDDAERSDESSLALLANLAERARSHALIVLTSVAQAERATLPFALEVLSSRCKTLELRPLAAAETEQLLGSVFGDVPNLALLNASVYTLAAGNPRTTMELVQHLIDRGEIIYDAGHWSLPERLSASDLPASSEAAFSERLGQLGPLARRLAEAQALLLHGPLTRADYALLEPTTDSQQLDRALDELVGREIVRSDGATYALAHRSAVELICGDLSTAERNARHLALAQLCEQSDRPAFAAARHLLLAQERAPGLERLMSLLQRSKDRTDFVGDARMDVTEVGRTLALALAIAETEARPRREQFELRRWMTMISVATDEELYWQAAPEWLAQLERDSGLLDWRSLEHTVDAGQRLMAALQAALQRTAALPEAERAYSAEEAIRLLVHYVAISIAIGARSCDAPLLMSLPPLLEPFAALSPLIHAVWQNAIATCESSCHRQSERARDRWEQVYERLAQVTGQDQQLIDSIRYAIAFGVGLVEGTLG
ncbi:MAG TPA: protein kinase, partial [Polyangiales bacterium]